MTCKKNYTTGWGIDIDSETRTRCAAGAAAQPCASHNKATRSKSRRKQFTFKRANARFYGGTRSAQASKQCAGACAYLRHRPHTPECVSCVSRMSKNHARRGAITMREEANLLACDARNALRTKPRSRCATLGRTAPKRPRPTVAKRRLPTNHGCSNQA